MYPRGFLISLIEFRHVCGNINYINLYGINFLTLRYMLVSHEIEVRLQHINLTTAVN